MPNFIKTIKDYRALGKAQNRQDIQEVFRLIRDTEDGAFITDCQKVLFSFGVPATNQFLANLGSVVACDRWVATEALMAVGPQITDENLRTRVVKELLNVVGDEVWSARAGAVKALGAFYPLVEDPDLKVRLTQAFQRAGRDEHKYVRARANEVLTQLGISKEEAVSIPTPIRAPKTKPALKIENGRIPTITRDCLSILLVESSALGAAGPGGASFQNAIQSWNAQDFSAAAGQFREALRQGLDPLRQGYAYANLGTILLKKGSLIEATGNFLEVIAFEQALYESVHEAAQYLSVILEEVGRQEEAGLLANLASQTQAKLGYSLSAAAIEQARRLVHESQIG